MAAADDRPLAGQPWLNATASRRVLAALEADGRPARFVGGCVRDGLLGLPAPDELDLATPELPKRVLALLEAAGLPAIPTGLAHGTVTTIADGRRLAGLAGPAAEHWVVPGADHSAGHAVAGEAYEKRVTDFLRIAFRRGRGEDVAAAGGSPIIAAPVPPAGDPITRDSLVED